MKTKKLLLALLLCLASVAFVACGKKAPAPAAGQEQGVYYYEDEVGEHTLELDGFGAFVWYTASAKKTGTYKISDAKITLTPQGGTAVEGRIDGQSLIVPDDDGIVQVFVRRLSYTITFESNGGSSVASQTVINGKIVRRPADPVRSGYTFVAWYANSELTQPFAFNSTPVNGDITLYAKWIENVPGQNEYTLSFDAGAGVAAIAPVRTVSGKIPVVPEVERAGYIFKGWWISQTNSADAISYPLDEDHVFDADTTLFAVWVPQTTGSVLPEPVVRVNENGLSWDTNVSASSYHVVVEGPQGFSRIDASVTVGTYAIDFASMPAGRYDISVTAVASASANNSAEVKRVYLNKALARVSRFAVYGNSVLSFSAVSNATNYYITVDCGNKNHAHTRFNNGNFTTYNFANCDMQPGGIKFTVEAQGAGYYRSVSDVFVYENNLDAVEGLAVDGDNGSVSWYPVRNAAVYAVKIDEKTYYTAQPFFALDLLDAGDHNISVTPVTDMYNSPAPATVSYTKTQLPSPQDITVRMAVERDRWGDVISSTTLLGWNWCDGASNYELSINGNTFDITEHDGGVAQIDLSEKKYADVLDASGVDAVNAVRIRYKKGGVWSNWSESFGIASRMFAEDLYYKDGYLHWRHVMTAVGYEIAVNQDFSTSDTPESFTWVETGANKAKVTLTQSGVNVISVRVSDGEGYSNWMHISVVANRISLDSRGSNDVTNQNLYLEYGDVIELPVPHKDGYTFEGWYTTPGGAESNGKKFTESIYHHSGEFTLYAYYTPKLYEVTLDLSAAAAGTPEKVGVQYGLNFTLPAPAPYDATKAFKGWYKGSTRLTNEDGTGIGKWNYDEDDYIGGELKLTAQWYENVLQFTEYSAAMGGYGVYKGTGINAVKNLVIPRLHRNQPIVMITASGFESCDGLESITFYDTIQSVQTPQDTFNYCYGLKAVNVIHVEGNRTARLWSQDGVLFDRGDMDDYTQGSLGSLVFVPREKSGEFSIPEGVHTVGTRAFYYSAITGVIIPASVTTIGDGAFYGCSSLSKVTFRAPAFGQKVEELKFGDAPFRYCSALTNINLPARLGEMDVRKAIITQSSYDSTEYLSSNYNKMAFYGCSNLVNITVDVGNKYYSSSADGMLLSADGRTILYVADNFDFTKADGYDPSTGVYTVPAGISAIGQGAFYGCTNLNNVVIPTTVTQIGVGAFGGYGGLKKITFAGGRFGTLKLADFAFANASKLTEVVFENLCNVTEIGKNCFYYCSKIRSVSIPNTVTKVGARAFSNCSALATATFTDANADQINAGMTLEFGEDAFANAGITSFYVTNVVTVLPAIFSGCTKLTSVSVSTANSNFESEDNVLYKKGKTEIIFYLPSNTATSLTIADTVEVIGNGVFRGNEYLQNVTIPASVKKIGTYAFANCANLKSITFLAPAEGTNAALEIGSYAFSNCEALKSFTVPGHTEKLGGYILSSSGVQTLVISEGVTVIGKEAFASASELKSISIAASVTEIGDSAFSIYNSNEPLELLSFGTDSQLEKIGMSAFRNLNIGTFALPASVKEIGASAFANSKIATVDLSANVNLTKIHASAFASSAVETVVLPASLTHLGPMVFYNCGSLTSVTFDASPATVEAGSEVKPLYIGDIDKFMSYSTEYTEIGGTFMNCNMLTHVELPDRVVYIGPFTFRDCSALQTVGIGTKTAGEYNSILKEIGEAAFSGCTALTAIELPGTLSFIGNDNKPNGGTAYYSYTTYERGTTYRPGIGDRAFAGCTNLQTVTIAEPAQGATNRFAIGAEAFMDCAKLTEIVLPSSLATYSVSGYTADGLKNGQEVFGGCDALTKVVLTNPVNAQGAEQRTNCGYDDIDGILTTSDKTTILFCPAAYADPVEIPAYVTLIEDNAFAYCDKVPSVTFAGASTALAADESNALTIGASAFEGCALINTVVLPERTKTLGDDAFVKCTALTSITIPQQLVSFSPAIYRGSPNVTLVVSDKNTVLEVEGDALYSKDGKTLYAYTGSAASFTVPAGVEIIAKGAFSDKTSLTSVNLSNVKTIGANAFAGSGLTEVTIPVSVTFIDDRAFYKCADLETVAFADPETQLAADRKNGLTIGGDSGEVFAGTKFTGITFPKRLLNIGDAAFTKSKLTSVTIPGSIGSVNSSAFAKSRSLVSVTIQNGIRRIDAEAFAGCVALESVTLSNTLETIGAGAFKNTGLNSVTVPSTVTSIGENAFSACTSLTEVNFESGALTSIGKGAFAGCTALETFAVPASVKTLGSRSGEQADGVFSGCTSLATVTFGSGSVLESIGAYTFCKCPLTGNFTLPAANLTTIGTYAFAASGLTEIAIPSGVTTLGTYLFISCKNLTTVSVPASVTTLPGYAFYNCTALENITLASGMTTVGSYAFYNCTALSGIELPGTVTSIGTYAFAYSGLTSFSFPAKVTAVSDYLFHSCARLQTVNFTTAIKSIGGSSTYSYSYAFTYCSSLTELELPDSIESIGGYAFAYCSALQSIKLPKNIKFIAYNLFDGCEDLEKIEIPDSVTVINGHAFSNCTSLTSVKLPNNVDFNEIPYNLFDGCTSLENVGVTKDPTNAVIPDSVVTLGSSSFMNTGIKNLTISDSIVSIPSNAFAGCSDLVSLTLPGSLTSILTNAFKDCTSLTEVAIGAELREFGVSSAGSKELATNNPFGGCTSLTGFTVDANNGAFAAEGGVLYNAEKTTLIAYPAAKAAQEASLTVESTVRRVQPGAFSGVSYAKALAALNAIDASLAADEKIDRTADYLFSGVAGNETSGKKVLDLSGTGWTEISEGQFAGGDFDEVVLPNTLVKIGDYAFQDAKLTTVNIPNSVTKIGSGAFQGTKLTEVTIPNSVTVIEYNAFSECTDLATLTFEAGGTSTLKIGGYAFRGTAIASVEIPYRVMGIKSDDEYSSDYAIGYDAFENCTNLSRVTFGARDPALDAALTAAGKDVSKMVVYAGSYLFAGTKLKSIVLPERWYNVSSSMFNKCAELESVVLPVSLTDIGSYAFDGCPNFKAVYYMGRKTDWAKVTRNTNGNAALQAAKVYFYDDGHVYEEGMWGYSSFGFDTNGNLTGVYTALTVTGNWTTTTPPSHTADGAFTSGTEEITCTCAAHGGSHVATREKTASHTIENGVCTVCHQKALLYEAANDETYPFRAARGGKFTSTNKKNSTAAAYTITAMENVEFSFDYKVSSEENYDKFTVYVNGTAVAVFSGEESGTFSVELAKGDVLRLEYSKDSSMSDGDDQVTIGNLVAEAI